MSLIKDCISENEIRKNLKSDLKLSFKIFDTIDSTNTAAKKYATESLEEGLVVISSHQTSGRGRMGRRFSSPDNTGIYMSILLKPQINPENTVLITTSAAVAVSKAIEKLSGKKTDIKWVNDILIASKKVCGILTEGQINPSGKGIDFAILGIGINVYPPEEGFDEEIKDIAGYVFENHEQNLKSKLIAEILNNFSYYYKNLLEKEYYEYYKSRCFVIGKEVFILKNGEIETEGTILDLDEDFRLFIKLKNGGEKYISSGEISVKIK
ncbi:MAG: biotin--[Clostridia bacterium]|nr:biotin--[acetyl-CoA-carboxylase] ligase [Clostridia bacterium]MBQ2237739.1 biotin--[acetyl-CoA-carboxylase] ligase [Clostridia bacterium]MEE1185476.1 biotin--[acetyl-CoA-carboxylase] ligase [Acutalibacteraceae bacterium]